MFTEIKPGEIPPDTRKPRGRGRPPGQTAQGAAAKQRLYEIAVKRMARHGYELTTLVHGILEAGRTEPSLTEASRERLASLERDVAIDVYVTPT